MSELTEEKIAEIKRKASENGIELETRGEYIVRMLNEHEKEDENKPRFIGRPL